MSGQQPASATEQVVARAWQQALGHESFGVDDNFFDLGGHSVLLHMVQEQLTRELRRDVALVDLFRHPTVQATAAHLDGGIGDAVPERAGTLGGRRRLQARRTRGAAGAAR